MLESDADVAHIGRKHMSIYLTLPNYVNNLRRLGWGDDDLAGGGSDGWSMLAWGDADAVSAVAAHRDAGADHVCIQVLGPDATAPARAVAGAGGCAHRPVTLPAARLKWRCRPAGARR